MLRPSSIESQQLPESNIGDLEAALRGREVLVFTSAINARTQLRIRLRRPKPTIPSLPESRGKALDQARLLFIQGRIADALRNYETGSGDQKASEQDRETSALGAVLCFMMLGREQDARERALALRLSSLSPNGRLTALRAFAALSLELPDVATDGEEFRALNEIRLGNVPATRPQNPDLLLQAVFLLVREHRFETAAKWLLSITTEPKPTAPLQTFFLEIAATLIEEWSWNTPSDTPLEHETAGDLLNAIETTSNSLKNYQLDRPLLERSLRAQFQIAMRCAELTKADRLNAQLVELGVVLPPRDNFEKAVQLARDGDLEGATALLENTEPEWRGRFQRATMLFLADKHVAALAILIELSVELPGIPIVETETARRLVAQARYEEARRHAESAFRLLPGLGQRLDLAECLLAHGEHERTADLTRPYVDSNARAHTLLAQALEASNLPAALAEWERYLAKNANDWHPYAHVASLYAQIGNLSEASNRGWLIIEKWADQLPSITLFQSALLQNAAPLVDEVRLRRIRHIHELLLARGRKEDDRLRVALWMFLENRSALPPSDPTALAEVSGFNNDAESRSEAEAQRESRKNLAELYRLGHVSLRAAEPALGEDAAQLVLRLGDDLTLALSEPSDESRPDATLDGFAQVQLGLHEILALGRLSLLPAFEQRLGSTVRLHVFKDVVDDLLRLVLSLSQEAPREQHAQATRLLAASECGDATASDMRDGICWVSLSATGDELDLGSALHWLRESGILSVKTFTQAATGLPGPQVDAKPFLPLGLRISALRWLVERDLLATLSRAVGGELRVLHADLAELRATIARAGRRLKALALAAEAHSWLGVQQLSGKVEVVARPNVSLPTPKPIVAAVSFESVFFAVTEKEDLLHAPTRCLVAIDGFVRDLFSRSVFVPQSLHAFEWTEAVFRETKKRYTSCSDRVFGLSWLVRQLAPARAGELNDELLGWGDSSAFSGEALFQLARDYRSFGGRAARILAVQEAALLDKRHAHHHASHFTLAKVEAAFLRDSLERATTAEVQEWWGSLLARWHAAAAPQKLWLLSWVMSVLVDSASKAFERLPNKDTYRLSPNSTVDAATRALVGWSTNEPADVVGPAVADILLMIDSQRGGNPSQVDLAPIIVLLGNTKPPENTLSLSHPWMEPLVILSRTWSSNPLPELFETLKLEDGREIQITFADLLARAVELTEQRSKGVTFGLDRVGFIWPISPTEHLPVEVPLEAIVLSTKPEVTKVLGMEVASRLGRLDGELFQLLARLAEAPDDKQRRRAFALRAVASPMRLVRRSPALLAYWGLPFALPSSITVATMEQLRGLLTEPPMASSQNAIDRFGTYAVTIWKDLPYIENVAAQVARFPGVLGWQWALRTINEQDDDELKRARWVLAHPTAAHFGELWYWIATAWLDAAGSDDPEHRAQFAGIIDRLLEHLATSRERGNQETRALGCVREVIARLGGEGRDAIWLTYRLYAWWFELAINSSDGIETSLERLIEARQPVNTAIIDDVAEPLAWESSFDVRLSCALNALAACPDLVTHWAKDKDKPPWSTSLSAESINRLIQWASEDVGGESTNCEAMEWIPPLRTSTAALVALFRNGGKFGQLPAEARERWLAWIPLTPEEERLRPRTVVLQVIHFAALELASLTPIEGALLADRCLRSAALLVRESPVTALAIAAAAGQRLVSLDDGLGGVMQHVDDSPLGHALIVVYLDSALSVQPQRARNDAVQLLQKIGREVSASTVDGVIATDHTFVGQEPLRKKLLDQLAAEALIQRVKDLVEQGNEDAALDAAYDRVDELALAAAFAELDLLLGAARRSELPLSVLVGFLTISLPWNGHVEQARKELADVIRYQAQQIGGEEKANALLNGLI